MKNKEQNITETKINSTNTFVGVDALVSLPAVQINEITYGDSLELTGCVPAKADLILEDMPYNTTNCEWDKEPIDLKRYWESRLDIIKPTGVVCLTATEPFVSKLIYSNYKMFKYPWYWDRSIKSNFLNAKHQPIRHIETVVIFYRNKPTYNPQLKPKRKDQIRWNNIKSRQKQTDTLNTVGYLGNRFERREIPLDMDYPTELLTFSLPSANKGRLHPTQKPVGLFEYLIRTYTNEGDLVFDGFGGSGTTAIAAYRTKRNFIVIEKDKRYFEIASKRLYQERNPLSTFDEAS